MGIKNLNRYLLAHCSQQSIHKIHLKSLANKTVVIDTSIYLYKFIAENTLIENMYQLITIFHHYKITPIFIFDGKPPEEKRQLLMQRYYEKRDAEQKYNELCEQIDVDESISAEEKQKQIAEMENLKRKFVRIKDQDIQATKELLDAYGVEYYDAPEEADQLCVLFVKEKRAYACMSDDMDMFLYGCDYVLRGLSLQNHSVLLYDMNSILRDLKMDYNTFCEIMVLSGTDYNIDEKTSLFETIKWYSKYKKTTTERTFYQWLMENTKYITNYEMLISVGRMFVIETHRTSNAFVDLFENLGLKKKVKNLGKVRSILGNDGFVFL
jgi:flap endonuclease-1